MKNDGYQNVMVREFGFSGDLVFVGILRGIESLVGEGDRRVRRGEGVVVWGCGEYVGG